MRHLLLVLSLFWILASLSLPINAEGDDITISRFQFDFAQDFIELDPNSRETIAIQDLTADTAFVRISRTACLRNGFVVLGNRFRRVIDRKTIFRIRTRGRAFAGQIRLDFLDADRNPVSTARPVTLNLIVRDTSLALIDCPAERDPICGFLRFRACGSRGRRIFRTFDNQCLSMVSGPVRPVREAFCENTADLDIESSVSSGATIDLFPELSYLVKLTDLPTIEGATHAALRSNGARNIIVGSNNPNPITEDNSVSFVINTIEGPTSEIFYLEYYAETENGFERVSGDVSLIRLNLSTALACPEIFQPVCARLTFSSCSIAQPPSSGEENTEDEDTVVSSNLNSPSCPVQFVQAPFEDRTFSNGCFAQVAGAKVLNEGECAELAN